MQTYAGQIDLWTPAAADRADQTLNRLGVTFRKGGRECWVRFITAVTADQYSEVITELSEVGEPGVDWNFTLD